MSFTSCSNFTVCSYKQTTSFNTLWFAHLLTSGLLWHLLLHNIYFPHFPEPAVLVASLQFDGPFLWGAKTSLLSLFQVCAFQPFLTLTFWSCHIQKKTKQIIDHSHLVSSMFLDCVKCYRTFFYPHLILQWFLAVVEEEAKKNGAEKKNASCCNNFYSCLLQSKNCDSNKY